MFTVWYAMLKFTTTQVIRRVCILHLELTKINIINKQINYVQVGIYVAVVLFKSKDTGFF